MPFSTTRLAALLAALRRPNWIVAGLVLLALAGAFVNPLPANALSTASDRVLLTVIGAIEHTNADSRAEFDRAMLNQLGTAGLVTTMSWTDGDTRYEGVLARDVMQAVGARGTVVTATALNDYSIDIPISDFENYDVLFALSMNGTELTPRDKGPIWIVYPRDVHPELRNPQVDAKWIWQLAKIEIK